jgi:hypothetical protein
MQHRKTLFGFAVLFAACTEPSAVPVAPIVGPSRSLGSCRYTDDAATKTRTISGRCGQSSGIEAPTGWTLAQVPQPLSDPAPRIARSITSTTCTSNCPSFWTQPDASYLSVTARIPVGAYTVAQTPAVWNPIGHPYTSTDGSLTVSFDEYSQTGPVSGPSGGLLRGQRGPLHPPWRARFRT